MFLSVLLDIRHCRDSTAAQCCLMWGHK